MELAKKIQTILLPHAPYVEGCETAVYMAPAKHVGGDYYDIINLPGVDWIIIGDVSGPRRNRGPRHDDGADDDPHRAAKHAGDHASPPPRDGQRHPVREPPHTVRGPVHDHDGDRAAPGRLLPLRGPPRGHPSSTARRTARSRRMRPTGRGSAWSPTYASRGVDLSLSMGPGDVLLLHTDGVVNAWKRGAVGGQRNPERDMFGAAGPRYAAREAREIPPGGHSRRDTEHARRVCAGRRRDRGDREEAVTGPSRGASRT